MYSTGLAYLLWFLSGFGALGFHRFYLGKIPTGLLWMCTVGLIGIGSLYDFFTLGGQVREANIRNALYADYAGRRESGGWRYVNDGEARTTGEKERLERVILKLAKQNKGIVTASEAALEANVPLEEAKQALDTLTAKGFAELRVRRSGSLVYVIPELMHSDEPLEDF
jgi:TM2 domain-containing membrane protein YozV